MTEFDLPVQFLPAGTIVVTPLRKTFGLGEHYAVLTNLMGSDGYPMVIANAPETGGPALFLWTQFSPDGTYERAFYPSDLLPWVVMANADFYANTRYSLGKWNCEDFAYACHGMKPKVRQIEAATVGALLVGGIVLVAASASR